MFSFFDRLLLGKRKVSASEIKKNIRELIAKCKYARFVAVVPGIGGDESVNTTRRENANINEETLYFHVFTNQKR